MKQTYESCIDFVIASEPFIDEERLGVVEGAQKKIPEAFYA